MNKPMKTEELFILTSDKFYHIVQDNDAHESILLASFSVFQYNRIQSILKKGKLPDLLDYGLATCNSVLVTTCEFD